MKYKFGIRILLIFVIFTVKLSVTAQSANPFEITRKRDTFETVKNIEELNFNSIKTEVNIEMSNTINPFEVSHIPIRKVNQKIKTNSDTNSSTEKIPFKKITFFLLIITWIILLLVTAIRKSILSRIFRCITNQNFLKLVIREDNSGINPQYLLLYLVFVINFGLLIFYSNMYFWDIKLFKTFWNCIIVVLSLLLSKHLMLYLFSILFDLKKEMFIFNFLIYLFSIILGVLLIPVLPFYIYLDLPLTQIIFYFAAFLVALCVLLIYAKVFLSTINTISNSIFLFFIYLCGLELIPLFLLIKFWYNIWGL